MWLSGEKRIFTHYNADLIADDTLTHWSFQITRKRPSPIYFSTDFFNSVHEDCHCWTATCSEIYLNKNAQEYIPKLIPGYSGDPIEVELVIDNENPLFYVQRIPDVKGVEHLYASDRVYVAVSYTPGLWPFKKPKKVETKQIPKDRGRLPMGMFPEITKDSGIVGISIKLK